MTTIFSVPTSYANFVQHLLRIDAQYWEVRDSLDDQEKSRSGCPSSRYYSASSNYYGNSNQNNNGTYNQNYSKQDYRKKPSNHRKFIKKEKAKGAITIEDKLESESEHYANESDHDMYRDSDTEVNEIPEVIEDEKELKAAFRRFYLGATNEIRELIRHLSPQEKEERMRKGLCLYCGKPGHVIANCTQIQQKERGRAIREPEDEDIWSYNDDPLNWKTVQQEEQC